MNVPIVVATVIKRRRYESSTSSNSDEDWEEAFCVRRKRQVRPRIVGYENIVHRYSDHEFKTHFRFVNIFAFPKCLMSLELFLYKIHCIFN